MKKTFLLLLALLMVFSTLTACVSEPVEEEPVGEDTSTEEPAEEETGEEEVVSEDLEPLTLTLTTQNSANDALVAQIIMNQLGELGITVEIQQLEAATFNELLTDPTGFDMALNAGAGGSYIFSPWLLRLDQNRNNGTTINFFKDDEMQALLEEVSTIEGFTDENVDAFHQYLKEKLYVYPVLSYVNNVVAVSNITDVVRDDRGQMVPNAFEFATEPEQVVVAISADPADLSPFVGNTMGRIAVLKTVYEYLFEPNTATGEMAPMVGKSVEQTGDLTYEVTIFENVYDSDGNHITASDIAWAFNLARDTGQFQPLGAIEPVNVVDEYTVEFIFTAALGVGDLAKTLTEIPVLSQAAYEASDDQFATMPVTTAAYVLTDRVTASSLTFERRDDYWQTDDASRTTFSQANVQTVIFQIITEPAQHAIALETGEADISASVSADDVALFEGSTDYTIFKFRDNLTWYLQFNGSEGHPLTSQALRQAIGYAIDADGICAAIGCEASNTFGNANFGGYLTKWDSEDYYDYNLDMAKDLLIEAGYQTAE